MRKSSELSSTAIVAGVATPRAALLTRGARVSTFPEMPKLIQLRHVPDALHRQLKERAALAGLSLSDYLIGEAQKLVERPTNAEIRARLARRSRVNPKPSPAEVIRRQREKR